MQLNSGILERRHQNWPKALRHFQLARELEPSYCEPDYWVGATMINAGVDVDAGLKVRHTLRRRLQRVPAQPVTSQLVGRALLPHSKLSTRQQGPPPARLSTAASRYSLQQLCSSPASTLGAQLTHYGCVQELEKAVDCKYVAVEAFTALHQVRVPFQHQTRPTD